MQPQYTPSTPENLPSPRVVRCLSWCAVSSAVQAAEDKESLPDQRERNRAFIENFVTFTPAAWANWRLYWKLSAPRSIIQLEDAKQKHAAYGTLMSLLKRRAVDAIVLRDTDRLGRNRALIASIEEEAAAAGVVVIPREGVRPPLDWTSDGHALIQAFAGTMAQKYVRDLVTKRRTGMRGRVEHAKRFPMTPPYGYRAVYEGTPPLLAGYALDEAQAAVVRQVFELYLDGYGMGAIADTLNEQGHPTPSMARWDAAKRAPKTQWTDIMVLEIIKRAEVYAGYLVFNRESRTQQPPIMTEGAHPAILTAGEVADVQAARANRTTARAAIVCWEHVLRGHAANRCRDTTECSSRNRACRPQDTMRCRYCSREMPTRS